MYRPGSSLTAGPLYAAVTGILPPVEPIEVLEGIVLRRCVAEIFQVPMLAYAEPDTKGQPHPGPWRAVNGGGSFKCRAELFIPDPCPVEGLSPIEAAWLLVALIRLRVDAPIRLAAINNFAFEKAAVADGGSGGELYEAAPVQWGLFWSKNLLAELDDQQRAWPTLLAPHLFELWRDDRFRRSFTIFDQSRWSASAEASATMLWTAIEILLDLSASTDKGRKISAKLADMIAADEAEKQEVLTVLQKLYRQRGSIVHAGGTTADTDYMQLFRFATVAFQIVVKSKTLP